VHEFKWINQVFKFSDPVANSSFYQEFNTYSKGLRYYSTNTGVYNYFGVRTGFESNKKSFVFEPGISYNRFNIAFDSSGFVWNELWLKSKLSGSLGIFKIDAEGQYGLLDNKSNFRLLANASTDFGKWAELTGRLILQKYPGTTMNFKFNLSKIPVWDNNLEKITEFALYAKLAIKPLNLDFFVKQFLLDNYIYFDEKALVRQLDNTFSINQIGIAHQLKIWKFWFNNQLNFQTKTTELVRYPTWVNKHSLYYEGNVFKNHLFVRPGVDLRYISSYYADNYMPASGQFYIQNSTKLPNQWLIDLFVNFNISNFHGFVKMENVGRWFNQGIQYFTPLYPLPEAKFRIGLQWQFLN
jgi:hypothetical protein